MSATTKNKAWRQARLDAHGKQSAAIHFSRRIEKGMVCIFDFITHGYFWLLFVICCFLAFIHGFTSLSQGALFRSLIGQVAVFLLMITCLALIGIILWKYGIIPSIATLLIGWSIGGVGGWIAHRSVYPGGWPTKENFDRIYQQAWSEGFDEYNARLKAAAETGYHEGLYE